VEKKTFVKAGAGKKKNSKEVGKGITVEVGYNVRLAGWGEREIERWLPYLSLGFFRGERVEWVSHVTGLRGGKKENLKGETKILDGAFQPSFGGPARI